MPVRSFTPMGEFTQLVNLSERLSGDESVAGHRTMTGSVGSRSCRCLSGRPPGPEGVQG